MSTGSRALTGAGLGIVAAAYSLFTIVAFNGNGRIGIAGAFGTTVILSLFMALIAGPGAMLLSWLHAVQMGKFARRARTTAEIRAVGIALGMPLGVVNLALILFVCGALDGHELRTLMERTLSLLIPALAGGAGLGWGVTFGLKPGEAA